MSSYPKDFPLSTALEIISTVKSGQIKANRAKIAHDLWLLQGYAQLTIIGDPDVDVLASTLPPEDTKNVSDIFIFSAQADPIDVLQRVCDDSQSPDNISAQSDIPWAELFKWAVGELIKIALA